MAGIADDATGTIIRNVTVGPEGTVLEDWLGTSRRLYGVNGHHDTTWTADDAGAVTATARYDPWGNLVAASGAVPDWRFQGSWMDTSTGLAWSVARWYDPVQGAFISEDTLLGEPSSPASRHLYAYGAGEPVGSWDPSGTYDANSWEKEYCRSGHWFACNMSFWYANWALNQTLRLFGHRRDGTRANAFQHCIWAGSCAMDLGAEVAQELTNRHESHVGGRFMDLPPNRNPEQHEAWVKAYRNHRMDLRNNAVGIKLAGAIPRARYIDWQGARPDRVKDLITRECLLALSMGRLVWLK